MIYYPLSVLMLAGIREILIISTPEDTPRFNNLFKNGKHLGLSISYEVQLAPLGLAHAFIIGERFIGKDDVCLILGDNIFYGRGFTPLLRNAVEQKDGATIFGYRVKNPSNFGVVEFDQQQRIISIEEKPRYPKSDYAVTGLYFYDNKVIDIAKSLKQSPRGELEITDINNIYLQQNKLRLELLGRGFAWLDTGTHESLIQASVFIETIEKRQGFKIACIEEIAYRMGYINIDQLFKIATQNYNSEYGEYLKDIAEHEIITKQRNNKAIGAKDIG